MKETTRRNILKCSLFMLIFLILLVLAIGDLWETTYVVYRKTFRQYTIVNNDNQANHLRKILFWTGIWGSRDIIQGQTVFLQENCPVSNCYITLNQSEAFDSAAVIFHYADTGMHFPQPRNINQHWVFFNWESPDTFFNGHIKDHNGIFNLTMTYRADSDIYFPVAKVMKKRAYGISKEYNQPVTAFRKKKMIAWFVSKCSTPSKREAFVTELQKYINVDIYGRCGNLTCKKTGKFECYRMLEKNYKFYLSFENSLCRDYLTEKVFNILHYNVVPIVYGGANYSRDLPPQSYIDARDFSSPKELANYLKVLDKNETLYSNFLEWKSKYFISTMSGTNLWYTPGMCDLCAYINKPVVHHKVYDNIFKWWITEAHCERNITLRNRS